ncbi:MAG: NusG domain II-containing protein [Treponema sp.]|nr:NusG domain II-containing protein [Candidatus Treponema equifaecale]
MQKIKFGDILVFLIVLASGIYFFYRTGTSYGQKVFVHTSDNEYEYSLNEDGIYKVEGDIGITTFEIKNKRVRVLDSPCPNKICINQGWDNVLVCMPNQVVIETMSNEEGFDAVAK